MTRLVAVVGVLVLAHAVSAAAGATQLFSSWTLVEDGSKPPSTSVRQPLKVSQSPTTVTIETTATVVSGGVHPVVVAMVTDARRYRFRWTTFAMAKNAMKAASVSSRSK
jgi:hypothetical protein